MFCEKALIEIWLDRHTFRAGKKSLENFCVRWKQLKCSFCLQECILACYREKWKIRKKVNFSFCRNLVRQESLSSLQNGWHRKTLEKSFTETRNRIMYLHVSHRNIKTRSRIKPWKARKNVRKVRKVGETQCNTYLYRILCHGKFNQWYEIKLLIGHFFTICFYF
jgi:hypothetical protein